jgi:hypothetical protein
VEEALVGVEGLEGTPGDLEGVGRVPEVVETERQPERAHDERSVQVELAAVRSLETGPLPEAVVEPASYLGEPSLEAGAGQGLDRRVVVLGTDEQVDVGKEAQCRVGVVEVGECGSLQHPVAHTAPIEETAHLEEVGLELQTVVHGGAMDRQGLLSLFRCRGQIAVMHGGGQEPGDAVDLHTLDELGPLPHVEWHPGKLKGRATQARGRDGSHKAVGNEESGCLSGHERILRSPR